MFKQLSTSINKSLFRQVLSKTAATSALHKRCLNIVSRPSDLIGNTPLIDLNIILKNHGVDGTSHNFYMKIYHSFSIGLFLYSNYNMTSLQFQKELD